MIILNTQSYSRLLSRLFIICCLSFSFSSSHAQIDYCNYNYKLTDTYLIKKPELLIIKAIKLHGFDVKMGLEEIYGSAEEVHIWRIINITTENGPVAELILQMENVVELNVDKTKITLKSICFDKQLEPSKEDKELKKYSKILKEMIFEKVKDFEQ